MKKLLATLAAMAALALPGAAGAVTLHKVYLDGTMYLYDEPCPSGLSDLKRGEAKFNTGRAIGLCWIIEKGVMWFIDDNMGIGADDAADYKPVPAAKP